MLEETETVHMYRHMCTALKSSSAFIQRWIRAWHQTPKKAAEALVLGECLCIGVRKILSNWKTTLTGTAVKWEDSCAPYGLNYSSDLPSTLICAYWKTQRLVSHMWHHTQFLFGRDLANFYPIWNLTSLLAYTECILNAAEGDARRIFEHMGKERKSEEMKVHHLNPGFLMQIKIKFCARLIESLPSASQKQNSAAHIMGKLYVFIFLGKELCNDTEAEIFNLINHVPRTTLWTVYPLL